jgi:hypothetical protein
MVAASAHQQFLHVHIIISLAASQKQAAACKKHKTSPLLPLHFPSASSSCLQVVANIQSLILKAQNFFAIYFLAKFVGDAPASSPVPTHMQLLSAVFPSAFCSVWFGAALSASSSLPLPPLRFLCSPTRGGLSARGVKNTISGEVFGRKTCVFCWDYFCMVISVCVSLLWVPSAYLLGSISFLANTNAVEAIFWEAESYL